jgi:hypothetical protein
VYKLEHAESDSAAAGVVFDPDSNRKKDNADATKCKITNSKVGNKKKALGMRHPAITGTGFSAARSEYFTGEQMVLSAADESGSDV